MVITFDACSGINTATATSLTYSHTCTGSNRFLVVAIEFNNNTDDITGVTYNGVSMTQACKVQGDSGGNGNFHYLYYLINPASGANNVVISKTSSILIVSAACSYTGVKQSGQPDATQTKFAGVAATQTITITTVLDNSWVTIWGRTQNIVSASTNVTDRTSFNGTVLMGDSNGVVTPAGSFAQTLSDATASTWALLQISFSPAPITNNYVSLPLMGCGIG